MERVPLDPDLEKIRLGQEQRRHARRPTLLSGGRAAEPMHTVCHRKIHSVLDERTLARDYDTPEKLRAHPEIARFLVWLRGKPPTFTSRHRTARKRR